MVERGRNLRKHRVTLTFAMALRWSMLRAIAASTASTASQLLSRSVSSSMTTWRAGGDSLAKLERAGKVKGTEAGGAEAGAETGAEAGGDVGRDCSTADAFVVS